ncbi:MAG TPA: hypothetical protein VGN12_05520 [Pirellulales bacterium]
MSPFDDFDPTRGEEFEAFDVSTEPTPESAIESLGGLTTSEDEAISLLAARAELEQRLMAAPAAATAAASDVEPYDPNTVVGVGIGEKTVNGVATGQLVVKVLVKEKRPEREIGATALVPRTLNGISTDVEESGDIDASMFTARRRPAPGGVSIGNCSQVMAGTLGCLVARGTQLFILSNNHVLALANTSPSNTGISQPGRLDGGVCPQDIIARLAQYIPINFTPGATNLVDVAIARTSPTLVDRRLLRLGGVLQPIGPGTLSPSVGMQVQKSGRTTQHTRGTIDVVNLTIDVGYAPFGGVARFVNQFRVRGIGGPFSKPGDSGSLVTMFPRNQPVGLLFAGSRDNNMTFCNPIAAVLHSLGVTIVL